ncbi:MAG TPA: hypothetical protein VGM98_04595 [Schlesneria sp.]
MKSCCCTVPPKPPCAICIEGDNVHVDNYSGFLFDGETQFAGVTDSTSLFVIPSGCLNNENHSTACFAALNAVWRLNQIIVRTVDGVCVNYFGEEVDCDTPVCWWYATSYHVCPNNCTIGVESVCAGGPRGNDELKSEVVIDATSDPDYVLLIVQMTSNWGRFHCCIDGEPGSGAHPLYKMRVYYRVAKNALTCLCAICFEKYDEQLIAGSEKPCATFPDHIRVNVLASGATDEQYANANAACGDPDSPTNTNCAVESGCGETACSYVASSELQWVWQSGTCINGCKCPDHAALIAAKKPAPKYVGQELTVTIGCVTGDRPCSELLGICCHKDEDGENRCTNNISECDCQIVAGCWSIGTGITCEHPESSNCSNCKPVVGICCYPGEDEAGHCLDGVTRSACIEASGGEGCWVPNDDSGTFTCAGDHGGCTGCGDPVECSYDPSQPTYSVDYVGGSPVYNLDGGGCSEGCHPVPPDAGPFPFPGSGYLGTCEPDVAMRMMAMAPAAMMDEMPAKVMTKPTIPATPPLAVEPVGTKLSEILAECGIGKPGCGACRQWVANMDAWGIAGCRENRESIIKRLDSEAKKASWIQWAKVATKGYLSSSALLDEAIKRATISP